MGFLKNKWQEIRSYVSGWPSWPWRKRIDKAENIVDDPIDDLKHKIHGAKIFGRRIWLPSWMLTSKRRK
jgi:hypothetical protein